MSTVNRERLLGDLRALARFGALEKGGGLNRPAFSPACQEATAWFQARMDEAGLETHVDAAGNLWGRLGPGDAAAVICGSHIDTVPAGGWLDGALGVTAALECARVLQETGFDLPRPLDICSFRDEEGAYVSLLGSRAATGALELQEIERSVGRDGKPLIEQMIGAGFDPARIGEAARPRSSMAAYVELHIEQGPVLEARGIPIGIVSAIVGIETVSYVFAGESRHAGTTPIGARKDALRAASAAISEAYDSVSGGALSDDVRVNFGALEVRPGASNVVPGQVRLTGEFRARTEREMADARARIKAIIHSAAARFGVSVETVPMSYDRPASMHGKVMCTIADAAAERGLESLELVSGAGHDAQSFAPLVPAGMIFIPSRGGISHDPAEFSSDEEIVNGANVLLGALHRLLRSV